ncbi:MAG TPA: hypothetical protein VKW78_11910 [Terriglobales bacterium]|nr:hypothetical protein [Terriglobales bacterium]
MTKEASKSKTCRACNGTGKVNEPNNAAKRPDFHNPGGFSSAARKACPKCGGTGKI